MKHASRKEGVVVVVVLILGLGLIGGPASVVNAQQEPQERDGQAALVATTPHFAFFSDFDSNLHDALLEAGRDKNFSRPALFEAGDEASCFEGLPGELRSGWKHALDYYAEVISSEKWDQKQQYWIRMDLSGSAELDETRDMRFVGIARGLRQAAAPAYEACYWAARDEENRSWIAELVAQLELQEEAIAEKLAGLYATPLAGLPIRVDVMETVNWSGATTVLLGPVGGHIQISTPDRGPVAVELIFHEASHTLMGRGHPIRKALATAAKKLDLPLPRDLWHAVLFYTTGDAVRRVLDEQGSQDEEGYTPMLFAIGIFGHHHEAMKSAWTGYLDGERTLDEAAADLVRAAAAQGSERP